MRLEKFFTENKKSLPLITGTGSFYFSQVPWLLYAFQNKYRLTTNCLKKDSSRHAGNPPILLSLLGKGASRFFVFGKGI